MGPLRGDEVIKMEPSGQVSALIRGSKGVLMCPWLTQALGSLEEERGGQDS
jgi:hypothetical protein